MSEKKLLENFKQDILGILDESVTKIVMSDSYIPIESDISDSNKTFIGELSILFVDMKGSTDITEDIKTRKAVLLYRSFVKLLVKSIREYQGETRQFTGDGVLAVFQGNDAGLNSCDRAVLAARQIITLIDFCFNPLLKEKLDITITISIGINTGEVLATKVGHRGYENNENKENEVGVIWIGDATNYSSKYCNAADSGEIFIDEKTYIQLNDKDKWQKTTKYKGVREYKGFVAKNYYLEDFVDGTPVICESSVDNRNSVSHTINNIVDDLTSKVAAYEKEVTRLEKRSEELDTKEKHLEKKENSIDRKINLRKFNLLSTYIKGFWCKEDKIRLLEKDDWLKLIDELYEVGLECDYGEDAVNEKMSLHLAEIYYVIGEWDKAYELLCVMAQTCSWFSISLMQDILPKTYLRNDLKTALEERCDSIKYDSDKKDWIEALSIIDTIKKD